jgi:iron(III) transport system permease protein
VSAILSTKVRQTLKPRPQPALIGIAVLIGLMILIPLLYLVLRASQAEPQALLEIVWRWRNLELLANTLLLLLGVVGCSCVLALPLAWLVVRTNAPFKPLIMLIGVLPMAVPGYVGAYALLAATGNGGLIEILTGFNFPRPSGYFGALGILTLFGFPYLFMNFWSSLSGLDPSLEEAARSLGLRPWQVFWRVVFPQLRPALYSAGLLLSLHVLGDFGVVSLMRYETFSLAIYIQYTAAFDRVYAAWLALLLLGLAAFTMYLEAQLLRRLRLARVGVGAARAVQMVHLGKWLIPALVFAALILGAALLVPMTTIMYWLVGRFVPPTIWAGLLEAGFNSLLAALPAALLSVGMALPLAYLGVRYPSRLTRVLERIGYLGYATPPLALALAFVFFTLRGVPILYQTLTLLVLALALHFLAEAIGPIRAALYQVPIRLEEAARGLGLRAAMVLTRVTLPLIAKGILGAFALVFLSCLKELPISVLLSPVGFDTLPKRIWGYASESMFAEAAPYALSIVLTSSLLASLTLRREQRR